MWQAFFRPTDNILVHIYTVVYLVDYVDTWMAALPCDPAATVLRCSTSD